MSIIIRLQNLSWDADAGDVRSVFLPVVIPVGGVQIVGGEFGDAFIAFSTDEDARQGMMKDGVMIKGKKVKLLLSSRAEMKSVIEKVTQQANAAAQAKQQSAVMMTEAQKLEQLLKMAQEAALKNPALVPELLKSAMQQFGGQIPIQAAAAVGTPPVPLKIMEKAKEITTSSRSDSKERRKKRESRSRSRSRERRKRATGSREGKDVREGKEGREGKERREGKDERGGSRDRLVRKRRTRSRSRSRSRNRSSDVGRGDEKQRRRNNSREDRSRGRTKNRDDRDEGDRSQGGSGSDNFNRNIWLHPPHENVKKAEMVQPILPPPFPMMSGFSLPPFVGVGGMMGRLPVLPPPPPMAPFMGAPLMDLMDINPRMDKDYGKIEGDGRRGDERMDDNRSKKDLEERGRKEDFERIAQDGSGGRGGGGRRDGDGFGERSEVGGPGGRRPDEKGAGVSGGGFGGSGASIPGSGQGGVSGGGFSSWLQRREAFDRTIPRGPVPFPPIPTPQQLQQQMLSRYCLELKNVPISVYKNDIRRFLGVRQSQDFTTVNVKFVADSDGRRSDVVYVKCRTPEERDYFLRQNGKEMKGNVIEMRPVEGNVVDSARGYSADHNSRYVKVHNIPAFIGERTLANKFDPKPQAVMLMNCSVKKSNAFLRFSTAEVAQNMLTKTFQIGDCTLSMFICSEEEFKAASEKHKLVEIKSDDEKGGGDVHIENARNDGQGGSKGREEDKDIPKVDSKQATINNDNGNDDENEFKADKKEKEKVSKAGNKEERDFEVDSEQRIKNDEDEWDRNSDLTDENGDSEREQRRMKFNDYIVYDEGIKNRHAYRSGIEGGGGRGGYAGRNNEYHGGGGGSSYGRGYGPRMNWRHQDDYNNGWNNPQHQQQQQHQQRFQHRPRMQQHYEDDGEHLDLEGNTVDMSTFGRQNCVVYLSNVAYAADWDDVLAFLREYGFSADKREFARRFNRYGKPSGDFYVNFPTEGNAKRAAAELNGKLLKERTVKAVWLKNSYKR